MTDYKFGPWTVQTGTTCPVDNNDVVQVQLRGKSQIEAETRTPWYAHTYVWSFPPDDPDSIAYYRVVQKPVEETVELWGIVLDIGNILLCKNRQSGGTIRATIQKIDGELDWATFKVTPC